jgi:hypothetical protein
MVIILEQSFGVNMLRKNLLRFGAIVSFVLVLLVNYLATALPINGQGPGEVSANYPVLFTPAGYVFSIWGLIYLGLLGFVVYQALPSSSDGSGLDLDRVVGLFIVTNIFNSIWIFAWHYELLWFSLAVIAGLLITLIVIQRFIRQNSGDRAYYWFVRVPFSIYLGWVSVATIANTAVALYGSGWRGEPLGEVAWTIVMLVVATLLAGIGLVRDGNIPFGLVFIWAYIGIAVEQAARQSVVVSASALAAILGLLVVAALVNRVRTGEKALV